MSTIQDFYKVAVDRDFARQHQFRALSWTLWGQDVLTADPGHYLYIETASLPGREITNVPVPFMGLNFNVPGLATYGGSAGYTVSFRADSQYYLRKIMEHATRRVFNDRTSHGDYNTPDAENHLTIGLLGKMLEVLQVYTLVGVNVVNTGAMSYNLGDTGTIAKVDATLSYHYWKSGSLADDIDFNNPFANPGNTAWSSQNLSNPGAGPAMFPSG